MARKKLTNQKIEKIKKIKTKVTKTKVTKKLNIKSVVTAVRKTRSDKGKKRTPYGHRPGWVPKIIGRERAANVIEKYAKELEKAIKYNRQNMSRKKTLAKHKKDIIAPQEKKLAELQQAVKDLRSGKLRPQKKALAAFETAFQRPVFQIEKAYAQEALVYDRETNFRNMVLNQLQKEGVDIYNPSELYKVLKDNDIIDLLEFIEIDEGENFYNYIEREGASRTIADMIESKEAYFKEIKKNLKLGKKWIIK